MTKKPSFKPLNNSHLELLCDWLEKPHVLEWWNDHLTRDEIKQKYEQRINDTIICPYIFYLSDKPIGFIQYYWASKIGSNWWPDENKNTVGIDQFIGDETYLNQGYGTLIITEFVQLLFQNPLVKKIITDVDPQNFRAKRCYEKVGFQEVGLINTPDGKSLLMKIEKKP